jgi:protein-lysine methyltransferase-like protein
MATEEDLRIFGNDLLTCIASGQIEISVCPSRFTVAVSDRPLARPLARYQAGASDNVTNLRHEMAGLNDIDRQLIKLLDAEHDRGQLVEALVKMALSGGLTVSVEQQTARDPKRPPRPNLRRLQPACEVFRHPFGCCRLMIRDITSLAIAFSFLLMQFHITPQAARGEWQGHQIRQGDGQGGWVARPAQRQVLKHSDAEFTMPFGLAQMDNGDYRLKPESPALKLGFKPISFEQIGITATAEDAKRNYVVDKLGKQPVPVVAIDNVCAWPNLTLLRDGTIVATIHNQPSHLKVPGDVDASREVDR